VTGPSQSLILVIVLCVAVLKIIGVMGWWRLAGYTPPSQWRALRLYLLPVALLAAPFAAGWHPLPADALGVLLLAYTATAVFEESLWRGAILGLLRPTDLWRAVLLSALLFGLGAGPPGQLRLTWPLTDHPRVGVRGCRATRRVGRAAAAHPHPMATDLVPPTTRSSVTLSREVAPARCVGDAVARSAAGHGFPRSRSVVVARGRSVADVRCSLRAGRGWRPRSRR
jgi:hypothetical protein